MTDIRSRWRIYRIDECFLLNLLRSLSEPLEYLQVPTIQGLPDDANIDGIFYNFALRSFDIRVVSESFPEVPPGSFPPDEPGFCHIVMRREVVYQRIEDPHPNEQHKERNENPAEAKRAEGGNDTIGNY